ncbi:hypothetical protein [Pyxidicoccus trucidator]|uniref:hypothetical protein n=1 Tax=Pyxidicoccus trucidator TaxID=2709662 RepID=UPI0013DB2067|nr:hypothetical protein [Pyxidicoccus trucidator]
MAGRQGGAGLSGNIHFAARIGDGAPFTSQDIGPYINTPTSVRQQPLKIQAKAYVDGSVTVDHLLSYCSAAADVGGWAVVIFHSIGGSVIPVSQAEFTRFVSSLSQAITQENKYWVAPVRDVANYIYRFA